MTEHERCDRHGLVLIIEGERRACPMCDRHEATVIVARTLKRLYPMNPDVVLGREARVIVEALESVGLTLVRRVRASDESAR